MVRVCVSIAVLLAVAGCALEQARPPAVQEAQVNDPQPKENILACTGLPVAGQKCGLALPKL